MKRKVLAFDLYLRPDGSVVESTPREARMARKVAGLIELEHGGMVVMSTDVNATAGRGFVGLAKGIMRTWFNRLMRGRLVDDEMKALIKERGMDTGWSIGNLFKGRYYSPKSDQTFSEKSFSIDIRGVPFDFVEAVGEALKKKFKQESVLLINHKNGRSYILD